MSNTAVITRASRYGRFRPQQLRATGGFSDVYLARDNTGKAAAGRSSGPYRVTLAAVWSVFVERN